MVVTREKTDAVRSGVSPEGRQFCEKGRTIAGIAALFLWSCAICALSLYYTAEVSVSFDAAMEIYGTHIGTVLLNLLPVMLLTAFGFFLTRRVWAAAIISGFPIALMTFCNYYKLQLRGDPLVFLDVGHIIEAADMVSGTGNYDLIIERTKLIAGAVIIAALILTFIFVKFKSPFFGRKRFIMSGISLAVLVILTPTLYASTAVYGATDAILNDDYGVFNEYSDADQYVTRGVVYSFLNSASNAAARKPAGYNKNEAAALAAKYESADIPADKRINVMAIMLESYNDFSKFGVEFEKDPYENYHALLSECVHGEIVTNIFAGGTIDTERAFLTGFSEFYEFDKKTPSLASYLDGQGYSVVFHHPGYQWFYNRQNVNKYMGFEDMFFEENRYDDIGFLYNDSRFFADILKEFKSRITNIGNCFSYSVTYNNHGPYDTDMLQGDVFVGRGGYSEEAWYILNNYFHGISRTDKAMKELTDGLRDYSEPTVLVMFGDHNPWMGTSSFVFDELGVNLDRDTEDGFYNYYCTPYVLWANDAAKKLLKDNVTGYGGSFSSMLLREKLMSLCSWQGDTMNMAQEALLSSGVDVLSVTGLVRENGVLTKEPTPDAGKAINEFLKIQYYVRTEG
ncbi:MAG: LTA synthase family protein [Oscillospiraceae bacterium]|nr:LTA synthase family protein [Oscillospiraceae bacterium]